MEEESMDEKQAPAPERKFGLDTVLADALAVITNPAEYYRTMPTSGGYAEPAIFVAVMGAVSGLLSTVFALIGFSAAGALAAGLAAVILVPIFVVIGSFIGALVMFVIWKLMGSEGNYECAFRCVAASAALYPVMAVLGLIPYLGTVIGTLWGIFLMFTATTLVHKITRQKAMIVFSVLGVLLLTMQVSSEYATRQLQSKAEEFGNSAEDYGKAVERFGKSMEAAGENGEEMTPEEAGQAVGDFFRGMNEALEKQQNEEANK